MGCGCGGAENKYRPAADPGVGASGRQLSRPPTAHGLPKVWTPPVRAVNGPAPKGK